MREAKPDRRERARRLLLPILVGLVAFGALAGAGLFHTWLRVEGMREGYRLSKVTSRHTKLLREAERLHLEVATLKAPARIERLAREKLGMRPPRPRQVVVLHDVPAPPAATAEAPAPRRRHVLGTVVEVPDGP